MYDLEIQNTIFETLFYKYKIHANIFHSLIDIFYARFIMLPNMLNISKSKLHIFSTFCNFLK